MKRLSESQHVTFVPKYKKPKKRIRLLAEDDENDNNVLHLVDATHSILTGEDYPREELPVTEKARDTIDSEKTESYEGEEAEEGEEGEEELEEGGAYSEEEEDEDLDNEDPHASALFISTFFKARKIPFNREAYDNVFTLDDTVPLPDEKELLITPQMEVVNLFSRNICLYPRGTRLIKKCGPWGDKGVLFDRNVILKEKHFNSDGTLSSVIVSVKGLYNLFFLLKPPFFEGWCDESALESYHKLGY